MISFEVLVNGEKVCLAGIGEYGVLSGHVTWAEQRPEDCLYPREEWKPSQPTLAVGGLVDNEHVRWTDSSRHLEVGDEVTFRIVESDRADEPIAKSPNFSAEQRRNERYEYYRALKREFEGEESVSDLEEMDTEEARQARAKLYLEYRKEFQPDR